MRYVELAFTVPAGSAEDWGALLVEEGAAGVEERDDTTIAKAPGERVTLVVWIAPESVEDFLSRVRATSTVLPEAVVATRDRDEEEWRDAWKRYFSARRVGRYVIVPSWEKYAAVDGDWVLDLDPGRAFGTGGHPSTRLCLEILARLPDAGGVFLDVGCGSGVLAIACARRWPDASGLGVDTDPDAIDVSRENAERNQVAERIRFSTTPLAAIDGQFATVTANIQPEVLIPMADDLRARLLPGGHLLLSGILVEAAPPVVEAYEARGLQLVEAVDEEGWRGLHLQNLQSAR